MNATPPQILTDLAQSVGGTIEQCERLPDGSGCAVMSMPLPKNHWLTQPGYNDPPMPLRVGVGRRLWILGKSRESVSKNIREAARYAIRATTTNGTVMDFDPDAMVSNFVVGLLGYHTDNGFSSLDGDPPKGRPMP